MDPCTTGQRRASDFIITPYRVEGDRLVPDMPRRCLIGDDGDGCRLRADHWRPRKTGPRFPLCVVRCMTHGRSFTLYPPGHVPYGRVAIVPVACDGQVLRDEEGDALAWDVTIFRAAADATRGIAWPRTLAPGAAALGVGTWRTQGRRITTAAEVLGVLAEAEKLQPAVAAILGVPTLDVRDAAASFKAPAWRFYSSRGRALLLPRDSVAQDCLVERLLATGALVGLWGRAHHWDPTRALLRARGPP